MLALAAPGGADAATFCVNAPTCPPGGIQQGGDLQGALEAAERTFEPDDVLVGDGGAPYVGPFVYPTVNITAENDVTIKASGPGRPVLTALDAAGNRSRPRTVRLTLRR